MDRTIIKNNARVQINGNIGILFLIYLVIILCMDFSYLLIIAPILIAPSFALSMARVYIKMYSGIKPRVRDAFCGFSDFWTAFKTQFFTGLFTFLWSLLLIVPGIIKSISYSQAMYIIAENPGMSSLQAIEESKKIMNGHKMEYFILNLSFIGWHIVAFSFAMVPYIWILPYIQATYTNFYYAVKGSSEPQSTEYEEEAL